MQIELYQHIKPFDDGKSQLVPLSSGQSSRPITNKEVNSVSVLLSVFNENGRVPTFANILAIFRDARNNLKAKFRRGVRNDLSLFTKIRALMLFELLANPVTLRRALNHLVEQGYAKKISFSIP